MGVCNCSMFCCSLLYVHSSTAIILMGKRELIALLNLSSWCLVVVERLFLAVLRGCLQFLIVVFPDHTHSLFCSYPFKIEGLFLVPQALDYCLYDVIMASILCTMNEPSQENIRDEDEFQIHIQSQQS